jgi:hypothetical protein
VDISEEKFLKYFWWCWNKLKVHVYVSCFYMKSVSVVPLHLLYKLPGLIILLDYKNWWMMKVNGCTFRRRQMMMFPCQPILGSLRC